MILHTEGPPRTSDKEMLQENSFSPSGLERTEIGVCSGASLSLDESSLDALHLSTAASPLSCFISALFLVKVVQEIAASCCAFHSSPVQPSQGQGEKMKRKRSNPFSLSGYVLCKLVLCDCELSEMSLACLLNCGNSARFDEMVDENDTCFETVFFVI